MLTIDRLTSAADLLNLRAVAREAGINSNTLISRIQRATPLSTPDAVAIEAALASRGIHIAQSGDPVVRMVDLYLDPALQYRYVALGSDGKRYLIPLVPMSPDAWEHREPDNRVGDMRLLEALPDYVKRFYGLVSVE